MAEGKQLVKILDNGNKQFRSYFRFIGRVSKHIKGYGENVEIKPFLDETPTKNGKPQRVLQFDVETAPYNKLRVELRAWELSEVTAYNRKTKEKRKISWAKRFDPLPEGFQIIKSDFDKAKEFADLLDEGVWVDVSGHYEFDTLTNDGGKEVKFRKRIIDKLKLIENGQKVRANGKEFEYITDFENENFEEVNYFDLQIGIKSTYREEGQLDTKVNAVFLPYSKEQPTPKDLELVVPYVQPEEGKFALADAFMSLERGDFIEVRGTDNNRVEFTEVAQEVEIDESDPFADVDESALDIPTESAISGTKKYLEVKSFVKGSLVRGFLKDEEIEIQIPDEDPFENAESNGDFPFDTSDDLFGNDDDPFA